MAEAVKAIERLLKEHQAVEARHGKHVVYRIPGIEKSFIIPHQFRDRGRASKNALSELRRLLRSKSPAVPSTLKNQLSKLGVKSSTQKRIETAQRSFSRRPSPFENAPPVDPIAEKVAAEVQAGSIARDMKRDVVEHVFYTPPRPRPRHKRDAPPVRHLSAEEIETENRKLREQEAQPKKEAWTPPVPVIRVGDEMIVNAPSITFKSQPAKEEDWMNTTAMQLKVKQWRATAEGKTARARELFDQASTLEAEAAALQEVAAAAEKLAETFSTNATLLEEDSKPTTPAEDKCGVTPIKKTVLADMIATVLEKEPTPLGTGELMRKLRPLTGREVGYAAIYAAAKSAASRVEKTNEGFRLRRSA